MLMQMLNKLLISVFGIEFVLNIAKVYFQNRASVWLFNAIVSPTNFSQESYSLYNSSSYLVYSGIVLILLGLFIYSIRYLRDHNIWFEETLDFKNRTLISKLVSVIFLARYVVYVISDLAYIGLSSTPTPNPKLANFLFAHHLFRYRLAVETSNPTIKTPIAISFLFLTDMIDSLVYAIIHFFIIVYLEYRNDPVSSKEILYPVSNE